MGWALACPYLMKQINRMLSNQVAALPGALRNKNGCWHNSAVTLFRCCPIDWLYVEGLALRGDRCYYVHAWIETPGGAVIDVTDGWTDAPNVVYFPVAIYTSLETAAHLAAGGRLPRWLHETKLPLRVPGAMGNFTN